MRFFTCLAILYAGDIFFQYLGVTFEASNLENMTGFPVEVGFIIAIALVFIQDIFSIFK